MSRGKHKAYHVIDTVLRNCVHSRIRSVSGAVKRLAKFACRVAEGGAERVMLVHLRQPLQQLGRLRQSGFEFLPTAAGEDINPTLSQSADKLAHIPGSGEVESLNSRWPAARRK